MNPIDGSGFDVPKRDGVYFTWIPKESNPSKLILHKWIPEKDKWQQLAWARYLPSKLWDSLENKQVT